MPRTQERRNGVRGLVVWSKMKSRSVKAPGDEALYYYLEEVMSGLFKLSGLKISRALEDSSSTGDA